MPYSAFKRTDCWIFDLDNTLYPARTNLFAQINKKIAEYVQRVTGHAAEEAQLLKKRYYLTYGTTLNGLMKEHDVDPFDYLEYVHDIDHSALERNEKLGEAIAKLPGRRFILTNGTRRHAEAVAGCLGITHHFDEIFGIIEADFVPKPSRQTYEKFLATYDVVPEKAAMFEDLARNLLVPHDMGMRTILIEPCAIGRELHKGWDGEQVDLGHVEHKTQELDVFLERVLTQL
ncbi:pyrimidine 5'-nucleotidase [Polycladidibacter stylochi]|uniref:pyrimidine 5'-nucleotidase n=1 Tax=Polycladidibacter stylochi TaxID=1807766 RepID=UPI000831CA44|nr:pyrimidine 5'-nucleotidase [Pseudovibrio stylochi]